MSCRTSCRSATCQEQCSQGRFLTRREFSIHCGTDRPYFSANAQAAQGRKGARLPWGNRGLPTEVFWQPRIPWLQTFPLHRLLLCRRKALPMALLGFLCVYTAAGIGPLFPGTALVTTGAAAVHLPPCPWCFPPEIGVLREPSTDAPALAGISSQGRPALSPLTDSAALCQLRQRSHLREGRGEGREADQLASHTLLTGGKEPRTPPASPPPLPRRPHQPAAQGCCRGKPGYRPSARAQP